MALLGRGGSRRKPGVLASFLHVDAAADAIRALRARGIRNMVVYSAAPNHELEEALEHRVSPVRLFTLIGGLTGCAAGFGMTLWSGVTRLVCGATRDDAMELGFDEGPINEDSYRHLQGRGVEVVRGILRTEARAVLKRYQELGRPIY